MSTLAEVADRAQAAIGDSDAGTWTQKEVEAWVCDGLRELSRSFPREASTDLTTTEDDREYDLPDGFQSVVSVEYPQGQDPPCFLQRKSFLADDFWGATGYYDAVGGGDDSDAAELFISEEPDDSETIRVRYLADHDWELAAGDTVTLPGRYHHLLVMFVVWQAMEERAAHWAQYAGQMSTGPYVERFDQSERYAALAEKAERRFVEALTRAQESQASSASGWAAAWRMDSHDPVY